MSTIGRLDALGGCPRATPECGSGARPIGGEVVSSPSPDPHSVEEDERNEAARIANGMYGVIVSSAAMVSIHGESVRRLAVAVLVTLLIYWAAERYVHIMAHRVVLGPDASWRDLNGGLKDGWEFVTASFAPLLVLVGSHWLGASLSTAVFLALLCGTGVLALAGWRVGSDAGLRPLARLLSAGAAGGFWFLVFRLETPFSL